MIIYPIAHLYCSSGQKGRVCKHTIQWISGLWLVVCMNTAPATLVTCRREKHRYSVVLLHNVKQTSLDFISFAGDESTRLSCVRRSRAPR